VTVVPECFVLSVFCWLLCVCPWRFPGMLPLSACGLRALAGCSWRVLLPGGHACRLG